MRQAMPGIVVLLLAGHGAQAASYRVVSPVYACIDRHAAVVLGDAGPGDVLASPRNMAIRRQGHCLSIVPGARWERILSTGGLVLLRRAPPVPGLPPLYFRADAVAEVTDNGFADPSSPGGPAPDGNVPAADPGHGLAASSASGATVAASEPPIVTEPLLPPAPLPTNLALTAPQAETDQSLTAVTTNSVNLAKAMQQGYVVGFLAAMLLLALVVAVLAVVAWTLLRNARAARDAGFIGVDRDGAGGLSPILAGGPGGGSSGGSSRIRRLVMTDERRKEAPVEVIDASGSQSTQTTPPPATHRSALPPLVPPPPRDPSGYRAHCIALLEAAGWRTTLRPVGSQPMPDLVAERDGRVLTLLCLPAEPAVDEDSIELACVGRDRRQADMAAIVSNASFTAASKLLATQTGIVLLHEDELAAFAA